MTKRNELYLDFAAALGNLGDQAASLKPAALTALSGADKKELGDFARTWVGLADDRRRQAAQMLVELAEEDFKNDFDVLFRYLLNDEDAIVRSRAIDGLWEDEDPALIKPLVGFLRSDPSAEVRASAADSLGRFVLLAEFNRLPQGPLAELIHEALLATIRSANESTAVRARAVESLAYWGDDLMRDIIAAAYADKDAEMRAGAVTAMGRSADAYWRKTVAAELDSPSPRMRFEAARAAGELENRDAVPLLIELLDDADREVQSAAVAALGQIGGRPARAALVHAAQSADEVIRSLAGDALGELDFTGNSDLLLFDMSDDAASSADEVDWDEEVDSDADDQGKDEESEDWDEEGEDKGTETWDDDGEEESLEE